MRIEELPDKTGIEVSGRGILHLPVLKCGEHKNAKALEFQGWASSFCSRRDAQGHAEPIGAFLLLSANPEYAGKVIGGLCNVGGTMSIMDTGETHAP